MRRLPFAFIIKVQLIARKSYNFVIDLIYSIIEGIKTNISRDNKQTGIIYAPLPLWGWMVPSGALLPLPLHSKRARSSVYGLVSTISGAVIMQQCSDWLKHFITTNYNCVWTVGGNNMCPGVQWSRWAWNQTANMFPSLTRSCSRAVMCCVVWCEDVDSQLQTHKWDAASVYEFSLRRKHNGTRGSISSHNTRFVTGEKEVCGQQFII